jgi:hypothetical protein
MAISKKKFCFVYSANSEEATISAYTHCNIGNDVFGNLYTVVNGLPVTVLPCFFIKETILTSAGMTFALK